MMAIARKTVRAEKLAEFRAKLLAARCTLLGDLSEVDTLLQAIDAETRPCEDEMLDAGLEGAALGQDIFDAQEEGLDYELSQRRTPLGAR